MREIKLIGNTMLPFVVTFFAMYLVGSFVSVSWDIAAWTWELRVLMATFGITFGFALWMRLECVK
jgi:Sec-independent protein secretion pathway component TatC